MLRVIDPESVKITFNGVEVKGFAPGDFVSHLDVETHAVRGSTWTIPVTTFYCDFVSYTVSERNLRKLLHEVMKAERRERRRS